MLKKLSNCAITVLFVLASVFTFVSCDNDIFGNNRPMDITLNSTLMEFDTINEVLGKNLQLEATVSLKGGGTSKDVIWQVPEDTTAFKTQSTAGGILTFQIYKSGTYVITAKASYDGNDNYKQAQCVITINDALTHLRINNVTDSTIYTDDSAVLDMKKGDRVVLAPVFTPSSTSQTNVLWSTSSSIINVENKEDKTGILTATNTGSAVVTLLSQDNTSISRTLKVNVKDSGAEQEWGVKDIKFNSPTASIEIDKSFDFTATVIGANGTTLTSGKVEFSLDNNGSNNFQLSDITARSVRVTAVNGGEGVLTATYTYSYTDETTGETKSNTVTASAALSVTGYVKGLKTAYDYLSIIKNEEPTIDVYYNPDATVQKGFTVSGYDTNVISVKNIDTNGDSFTLYGRSAGKTAITLTSIYDASISTTLQVNVSTAVTKSERVKMVKINNTFLTIEPKGSYSSSESPYDTATLKASIVTLEDSGAETYNDKNYSVLFESSDPSVLEVTKSEYTSASDGYTVTLTAKKPGTAVITAKSADDSNKSASCTVTVTGALESMISTQETLNLTIGNSSTVELTPVPFNAVI